jgi:hypothetical protein
VDWLVEANVLEMQAVFIFRAVDGDSTLLPTSPHGNLNQKNIIYRHCHYSCNDDIDVMGESAGVVVLCYCFQDKTEKENSGKSVSLYVKFNIRQ